MAAYQMYRNTTLGITLQETLDELVQNGQITPQLAIKVMTNFDKVINKALSQRVKAKLNFKASHLKTYRFCDNVWTFVMEKAEFRENTDVVFADKIKFVACDGRAAPVRLNVLEDYSTHSQLYLSNIVSMLYKKE